MEGQGTGAGEGFDAVFDGILDEGLEEQGGDGFVEQGGIDVAFDLEPGAEAHLFEVEIAVDEAEFLAKGDGGGIALVEGVAE